MKKINIFLPSHISVHSRHVVFGVARTFTYYTIVNCVGSHSFDQDDFIEKTSELCSREISDCRFSDSWNLSLVGIINSVSPEHRPVNIPTCFSKDVFFVLYVDVNGKILWAHVKDQSQDAKDIRVIIYDTRDILLSCLVQSAGKGPVNEKVKDAEQLNFPVFLKNTTAAAVTYLSEFSDISNKRRSFHYIDKVRSCVSTFFYKIVSVIVFLYEHIYRIFTERFPKFASKAIQLSSVGSHIQRRLHHIHQIASSIKRDQPLPLSSGNLISAIIFDMLCGWIFTYLFWHYCTPSFLLRIALEYTGIIVNELQSLLHWLMGIPAGLKLNVPLNTALGHFFLYHIYLWKTYMAVVRPIFAFVLEGVALLSIFGLTFIICLFNDLLSVATIHIYCFYGYAARLYGYQVSGLASSWRLFRGRKWNPLRHRIDSYTYDVHQLYLGTLFFTILTFLLPTVMAYYTVFTTLRIAVLSVQGIITRAINLLSIFPVYVIILRVCRSKLITGDFYFSVVQEQKVLILNMELVQISLKSVIQKTQPEDVHKGEPLSWKMFTYSLIWGKIIYPI